jgi:hypothetical protein
LRLVMIIFSNCKLPRFWMMYQVLPMLNIHQK